MRKKVQAFTLIELLVTMTIAGLLFVITMPVFSEFQSSSRLKTSAQIVETFFGEAFSSARSRPKYFVVEGWKELRNFELNSCNDCECSDENQIKNIRKAKLGTGVKFRENFNICFVPPFGDIAFSGENLEKDYLDIEVYNENSIFFRIYKKSGLITYLKKNKQSPEKQNNPTENE